MTPAQSAVPLSFAHIPAGSPWWIYALVIAALVLHIGGGSVAILAGYGAATMPKGEHWHRLFGKVFVAAMLVMASAAFGLAVCLGQRSNIGGALLAFYLVLTAWLAARRGDGRTGLLERLALALVLGLAVAFFSWGVSAEHAPKGTESYSSVFYFIFAGIAGLLAATDIRVVIAGSPMGVARIARHLWRMCFAFFFAAGSFFLGQQKVMPVWMHGSPVLWTLGLAPLGFLIFWLVRVRIGRRFKPVLQPS
jgi:hypothetical protein